MKITLTLFALFLVTAQLTAQTVVVTDDNTYTTGQTSSVLDVKSTSKGFLAPRMTSAQRVAITSPAEGLLVYQTDAVKGFYYYSNSAWQLLSASWALNGNAATSSATQFLGTTDNISLKFRTNNAQRLVIDSVGCVGIGASPAFTAGTAQEKLLVDAGTTNSYNAIVARGSTNNYFQLNIQNQSNGVNASSDIVATADDGNETDNFIDLGINSSGNTQGIMGGASDAYLYTMGNNLLIGTGSANKSLVFMTGGTTQATNERARIDPNGNLGIGITAPTAAVHLKAGTATAGTAPLKLTAGTNLTTAENGAVEFDGTNYYATSGGVRYTLAKTLTATASLNFPATGGSWGFSTLNITVAGATDGDVVNVGIPSACILSNSMYTAYVSAANTVTVRFTNTALLAQDPAAGTFRVSITKY